MDKELTRPNKDNILAILREHEPELRAVGLVHLRLFGSVARGDENADSDVDLLADLYDSRQLGLVASVGIENRLTDLLATEVLLSLANSLRTRILELVAREAVPAF